MGSRPGKAFWAASGAACLAVGVTLSAQPAEATSAPAQAGLFAPANDAVSANRNPAGLTRIQRPEWVLQGLYFHSDSRFRQKSSSGEASIDNNDGSTFIPFVYYARPLTERLGFGFYVTGMSFSEDLDDSNPSRYLVDEWQLGFASLVPSLAYRIGENLSFGASLAINYNFYEFESAVLNPGGPDGRMELEDDDISFGFSLGALYEFSPRTRVGLVFNSETEASFEDTPSFSGVNRTGRKISFDSTFPASVGAGLYHEFPRGSSVTLDLLWMNFAEFGLSEVRVGQTSLSVEDGHYENFLAGSVGYTWQLDERWKLKLGGLYVDQPIRDRNRTFTFRLDRIWGLGIGAEWAWRPRQSIGLNLTYYDLGKGRTTAERPVPPATLTGEFTHRYAILLDLTFRWVRGR